MVDTRLYVSAIDTSLTTGASIGATSITLDNLVDIYGNVLTMASFGTKGWGRIDPEGDGTAEDFTFAGVTANSNGTYTLTTVKTALAKSPYTETSGLVRAHSAGAIVRFSNPAGFYDGFANKYNDETITGTWTFPNGTPPTLDSYAAPTDNAELAAKKYVDDVAAGGTASINRVIVSGTAGETVAAGNVIYLDETDNEWKLADASASATCDNVQLGIAQGAGTNGNAISGGVLVYGRDANQSGLAQGDKLYISDTSGAIATSAGTVEVEIGHAISATAIDFAPKYGSYTTAAQRAALAGNDGTYIDSANKVCSQKGLQQSDEIYAASATGNDTYVITLSPVPAAYTAGMTIRFKPDTANTGACSLNVNSLGAKAIKINVSDDPQNNTLKASGVYEVVYDGTNFQLINTAEVLHGGSTSDADNFHYHSETQYMLGVRNGTRAKTYWNFMLPLLVTANVPTGDILTLVNTTFTTLQTVMATCGPTAGGTNTVITSNRLWTDSAGGAFQFSDVKTTIVEFGIRLSAVGTHQCGWGLSNAADVFIDYDDQVDDSACFTVSAAGALYAHTGDAGTGHTETLISGITLTNLNTYRIELNPGTNALFYVNDVLKATITTNLPNGNNDVKFGWGSSGNTDYVNIITAPYFAIQK